VKDYPEILISKVDKGITVAQDRSDYINKMKLMLRCYNTYERITKDLIKKLTTDLHSLINRSKNKRFIDDSTYKGYGEQMVSFRERRKIHKQNYPLRIIISSINSPFYNLI